MYNVALAFDRKPLFTEWKNTKEECLESLKKMIPNEKDLIFFVYLQKVRVGSVKNPMERIVWLFCHKDKDQNDLQVEKIWEKTVLQSKL